MPTLQDSNKSLTSHEQSCQGSPKIFWGFASVYPVDKPCRRLDSDAGAGEPNCTRLAYLAKLPQLQCQTVCQKTAAVPLLPVPWWNGCDL